MKLNFFYPIFILLVVATSCNKNDGIVDPINDDPIIEPTDTSNNIVFEPCIYFPGDTTFGFAQAIQQDTCLWSASAFGETHSNHPINANDYFLINMKTFQASGAQREDLVFSDIKKNTTGSYTLSDDFYNTDEFSASAFYFIVHDDALEDSYIPNESTEEGNKLVIDSVDTENQIYWGSFNVSFIVNSRGLGVSSKPYNPLNMKLINGKFWVKIRE